MPSKASAPRPIFSIASHHAALAAQHLVRQRDDEAVRRGGGRGAAQFERQFLFVRLRGETCRVR